MVTLSKFQSNQASEVMLAGIPWAGMLGIIDPGIHKSAENRQHKATGFKDMTIVFYLSLVQNFGRPLV